MNPNRIQWQAKRSAIFFDSIKKTLTGGVSVLVGLTLTLAIVMLSIAFA